MFQTKISMKSSWFIRTNYSHWLPTNSYIFFHCYTQVKKWSNSNNLSSGNVVQKTIKSNCHSSSMYFVPCVKWKCGFHLRVDNLLNRYIYIYKNGRTDVCLLVCGGLMEIQTPASISMKFCTHIPTCPRKVLV